MTQANVVLSVRRVNSMTCIIAIEGALSARAEVSLLAAYERASTTTTRNIVLDCTRMTDMNSDGISLLAVLLTYMKRRKQRLFCSGLSEYHHHIFVITHLSAVIKISGVSSRKDRRDESGRQHSNDENS